MLNVKFLVARAVLGTVKEAVLLILFIPHHNVIAVKGARNIKSSAGLKVGSVAAHKQIKPLRTVIFCVVRMRAAAHGKRFVLFIFGAAWVFVVEHAEIIKFTVDNNAVEGFVTVFVLVYHHVTPMLAVTAYRERIPEKDPGE